MHLPHASHVAELQPVEQSESELQTPVPGAGDVEHTLPLHTATSQAGGAGQSAVVRHWTHEPLVEQTPPGHFVPVAAFG